MVEFKEVSLEGLEGKDLEVAKVINGMVGAMKAKTEASDLEMKSLKSELDKLNGNAEVTELKSAILKLEESIAGMRQEPKEEFKTVAEAVIEGLEKLEIKSFADVKNIKGGKLEIEIKAETVTQTTAMTGTVGRTQQISEPRFAPIRPLAFIPNMRKGYVEDGKDRVMWIPSSYTSNAGYVGETGSSASNDIGSATEKYRQMAKISAWQHISMNTFEDLPQWAQRFQAQLAMNTELFLDNQIYSGDGNDSTQPNHIYGLVGHATAFDTATFTDTISVAANVSDLMDAIKTQAAITFHNINVVWINPVDAYKLRRAKTTSGDYVISTLITGESAIAGTGIRVIETTAVTANTLLAADTAALQLWFKRALTLRVGQFGDDVKNDTYSAFLFLRAQALVEDEDKKALIKVTDIGAALALMQVGA